MRACVRDVQGGVGVQVAELNAKVEELEKQFNAATEDKEAAIKESERCQLKLQLANRLINALASEGESASGPCNTGRAAHHHNLMYPHRLHACGFWPCVQGLLLIVVIVQPHGHTLDRMLVAHNRSGHMSNMCR